jgi:hypothetical protein
MRVRATKTGFYGGVRYRPGQTFDIADTPLAKATVEALESEAEKEAADKTGKPVDSAVATEKLRHVRRAPKKPKAKALEEAKEKFPHDFSETWMEPVDEKAEREKDKDAEKEPVPAGAPGSTSGPTSPGKTPAKSGKDRDAI